MDPLNDSLWLHYLDGIKRRKEVWKEAGIQCFINEGV